VHLPVTRLDLRLRRVDFAACHSALQEGIIYYIIYYYILVLYIYKIYLEISRLISGFQVKASLRYCNRIVALKINMLVILYLVILGNS